MQNPHEHISFSCAAVLHFIYIFIFIIQEQTSKQTEHSSGWFLVFLEQYYFFYSQCNINVLLNKSGIGSYVLFGKILAEFFTSLSLKEKQDGFTLYMISLVLIC